MFFTLPWFIIISSISSISIVYLFYSLLLKPGSFLRSFIWPQVRSYMAFINESDFLWAVTAMINLSFWLVSINPLNLPAIVSHTTDPKTKTKRGSRRWSICLVISRRCPDSNTGPQCSRQISNQCAIVTRSVNEILYFWSIQIQSQIFWYKEVCYSHCAYITLNEEFFLHKIR